MKKNMILGIPSGSLLETTLARLGKLGIKIIINGRSFIAEVKGSGIFSKAVIMHPNDLPLALKASIVDAIITGHEMPVENGLEKELYVFDKTLFLNGKKIK